MTYEFNYKDEYDAGYRDGYDKGYREGYEQGFLDGRERGRDEVIDCPEDFGLYARPVE